MLTCAPFCLMLSSSGRCSARRSLRERTSFLQCTAELLDAVHALARDVMLNQQQARNKAASSALECTASWLKHPVSMEETQEALSAVQADLWQMATQ